MTAKDIGPDVVIVGAARSGTSFLSATLGRHSGIDAGAVKEPNYFSSRWKEGADWYDSQYDVRSPGVLRLDSSVSYTYPQHPDALRRLSQASPSAKVIYAVRNPTARLISMYQLFRYYAAPDMFANLGEAIEKSEMCLLSGDYAHWLTRLSDLFAKEQILVVPFPLITSNVADTLHVMLPWLGLPPEDGLVQTDTSNYRNEVREFRWRRVGKLQRRMHTSRLYPALRRAVGPDRLRAMRRLATRSATIPSPAQELATLTPAQHARLREISDSAVAAASEWLREQDQRYRVSWMDVWSDHMRASVV